MAKLLLEGLQELHAVSSEWIPDFAASVRIGLGDAHCNEVSLAFATFWRGANSSDRPCHARLLPSWIFADEPEPGMHPSYSAVTAELEQQADSRSAATAHDEARSRCFWAGNAKSDARLDARAPPGLYQPVRERFLHAARADPELFEVAHKDPAFVPSGASKNATDVEQRPIDLQSQAAGYRCLVDLRGAGFSSRVPALLFTGRPLLYIERPGLRTFYEERSFIKPWVPWVHYVPAAAELTDLHERAAWILSNPAEAARIGANAREYARCVLSASFARKFATQQLLAAAACAEPCAASSSRCSVCMTASGIAQRAADALAWYVTPPCLSTRRTHARYGMGHSSGG